MQIIPKSYSGKHLILTEDERASPGACIFKYQPGERIAKRLISELYEGKQCEQQVFHLDGRTVIGIFSPVRRCGKSQFSIALAQTYGEEGPTLLVCVDESSAMIDEQVDMMKDTLSDLLFCYIEMKERLIGRLPKALMQMGSFDFIYPADCMEDLYQISGEDWKSFIQMLAAGGGYDTVILELGQPVKGIFDILECCSTIYMPALGDCVSQSKIAQLQRKMENMGMGDLFLRMKTIIIPEDGEQRGEYFDNIIHGNKRKFADDLKRGKV